MLLVAFASFYVEIAGIVSYSCLFTCCCCCERYSNAGHIIHYVGLNISIKVEKNVRTLQILTAMFQVFGANLLRLFQQSVHDSVTMQV